MIGPMTDTRLRWFRLGDKHGFKGVLGGYPRQMIGQTKGALRALARKMKRGEL